MKILPAVALLILLGCVGLHAQESETIKDLKVAAESGDRNAARQLATAYAVGDGVARDQEASNHWYAVAAKLRNSDAVEQTTSTDETPIVRSPFRRLVEARSASQRIDDPSAPPLSQAELEAQIYPTGRSRFSSPSMSQVTNSVTSTWKKMVSAASSASTKAERYVSDHTEKAKQFASDHSDEITDLAQFLLERYVPGLQPAEGTTTKPDTEKATRPSK